MIRSPAGWPADLPPPSAGSFPAAVTGWLLDRCPPELRAYPVLHRHPVVLAYLATRLAAAQDQAVRSALAGAREALSGLVSDPALAAALAVLEQERDRLVASQRAVGAVAAALVSAARRGPAVDGEDA